MGSDIIPVMSFWTKPLVNKAGSYTHEQELRRFLYYWAISAKLAMKHYGQVSLVTDDLGEEVLVRAAGIKFTHVSNELNNVPIHHANWAGGKIYTYALQTRPFFHFDYDVMMWKKLPDRVTSSPMLAQNKEFLDGGIGWAYPVAEFAVHSKWHPPYFSAYYMLPNDFGYNAGIIGGQDYKSVNKYAEDAISILRHELNGDIFTDDWLMKTENGNKYIIILLEQYGFAAYSRYHGVPVATLFDSFADFGNAERRAELGYDHLLSQVKTQEHVVRKVGDFMRKNMHRTYRRINGLVERSVAEFAVSKSTAICESCPPHLQ